MTESKSPQEGEAWTSERSSALYGLDRWGDGYFDVAENGHLTVHPQQRDDVAIDLVELVQDLRSRGLRTPLLVRFSDVLSSQVKRLAGHFQAAIDEFGYTGKFHGVYPIKVNQQRHVVEDLVQQAGLHQVGLEAGSKPELLVALALLDAPGALIVCNGFKDRAYIETALLAQRLGRRPVIVVDRFAELDLLIKTSRDLGIRPHIGLRVRLSAQGAGRWEASAGRRSKFGLSPAELMAATERLRSEDMLDCLELVHYHIGSQITAIRAHKEAIREASRIYVGLRKLGATSLKLLDVGGGMGVDYDGTQTDFHSSINYSATEYANDVVDAIQSVCDEAGIPHPDIVTESGRAMAAHHSILLFDVIGSHEMRSSRPPPAVADDAHRILRGLAEAAEDVCAENAVERYHDALSLRDEATSAFALGYIDLSERGRADELFLWVCSQVLRIASTHREAPLGLDALERDLADIYYGNFSVFQSAPDHWAVKQLFPVMPIQRLDEEPTRRAVIADLTCDSDGKMDAFIDRDGAKPVLEVHPLDGRPYYFGVFMVGAYQEILGDLHNLFGDTDAVHVSVDAEGGYTVEHVVDGDSVSDVLSYVEYDPRALIERVRRATELALRRGDISLEDSALLRKRYQQGLSEYTYLSVEP